jgi:hypothetical protein
VLRAQDGSGSTDRVEQVVADGPLQSLCVQPGAVDVGKMNA